MAPAEAVRAVRAGCGAACMPAPAALFPAKRACAHLLQNTLALLPYITPVQYVATVHNAFVEGEGGLVYDAAGRAYHLPHQFFTRTGALPPLPAHTPAQVWSALVQLAA